MAIACKELDIPFIHISSEYVLMGNLKDQIAQMILQIDQPLWIIKTGSRKTGYENLQKGYNIKDFLDILVVWQKFCKENARFVRN